MLCEQGSREAGRGEAALGPSKGQDGDGLIWAKVRARKEDDGAIAETGAPRSG